jgi:hypothetical protein
VARALARWGHHDAAAVVVARLAAAQRLDGSFGRSEPGTTAAVLAAWAAYAAAAGGGTGLATELAGPAAKAAHRLGRRHRRVERPPWYAAAQHDAAFVLDRAGQPEAADLCRARAAGGAGPAGETGTLAPADLSLLAGPSPVDGARFLSAARAGLVDDARPSSVDLLGAVPAGWLGQDLEVHGLPTRAGPLSFAVRWHGARPALLWELGDDPAPGTVAVAVPGLDPAWSTTDRAGEALLAPVVPPGGLPAVVAPLPEAGTPVDDAPGGGVSFT